MTELAPGPWVEIDLPRAEIAPRLAIRRGVPAVHDGADAWVSLLDGARLEPAGALRGALAVAPDGRRVMRRAGERIEVVAEDGATTTLLGDVRPLSFLGDQGIVYRKRSVFTVMDLDTGRQESFAHRAATPTVKKQRGGASNVLRWVHRIGERTLSVADYDAVLWAQPSGSRGVAGLVATGFSERLRVLASDPPNRPRGSLRSGSPAIVLGPSDDVAYALGHERPSARMRHEGRDEFEADEAFTVWSRDHRLVRRAPGRLLAGWGDAAIGVSGGRVFRESMTSGERRGLCDAEGVGEAVAIAGTGHAVLFAAGREGERPQRVRFV